MRKVLGRTLSKAWDDSLFGMSSQAAFWSALSTAPMLLALLGLVGPVARLFGPDTIEQIKGEIDKFLNSTFNAEVAEGLVGDTVNTILSQSQGGTISVGLLISLWAGSSAMAAFVESIAIAYGQHEIRHPAKERFFSLFLYLVALLFGILLLPLMAVGPDLLIQILPASTRDVAGTIISISYYPALGIFLILLLTTLYKVAPKYRHQWKRGLPGAVLAAVLFIILSAGLRIYLSYVYAHGLTYGALATPITFLLFYYFSSMAIIFGAQFNNALLEYYPPRKVTTREWSLKRPYFKRTVIDSHGDTLDDEEDQEGDEYAEQPAGSGDDSPVAETARDKTPGPQDKSAAKVI
ncbi:YihY/virulence factor BrkB family protein [Epidermidibacterium keratini]|uniref:YihY/virulence factor BrkB family protein n=2 Tax=Epidermidibacterium keratini TaxID=1891644 RepID=A0A7L4YTF4_9ACTN|nr:YihY/virulence factor BrkB family protein [Epidermidibacterium keratini]